MNTTHIASHVAAHMLGDYRHAVDDRGIELPLFRGTIPSNQIAVLPSGERKWRHYEEAQAKAAGLSPLPAWPYGAESEVRVGVRVGKSTAGFDSLKALITEHFEGAMVLTRIESGEEFCRLHITHNGTDKVCGLRVLDLMSAKHGSGFLLFIIASIRKDLIEDRVKEQTSDADS